MRWRPLQALAFALAFLAWIAASGCGGDDEGAAEGGNAASPATMAAAPTTVSVAGEIGVPAGIDAFGITVFIEGTSYAAYTDSEGRYTISGVPPGEYQIRAMRQDLESLVVGKVKIGAEDFRKAQPAQVMLRALMDVREDLYMPGRAAAVLLGGARGRVVAAIPEAEDGVMVTLEGTRHRTVSVQGGSWEMLNIEPGDYTLVFSKAGFADARQPVKIQAGSEADVPAVTLGVAMSAGPAQRTVFGRVSVFTADGADFAEFESIRVVLEGSSFSATPDRMGRFEIRGVQPGVYLIGATAPGFLVRQKFSLNLESVPAVEVNLELVEDTTAILNLGSLYGNVFLEDGGSSGNGGATVSLAGTSHIVTTNAAGEYEILGIEPGTYTLMAALEGYEGATLEGIQVTAGDPVEVKDILLEAKVDRPRVVYTAPSDGARGVAIDQPTLLTIQFSQPMDMESVIDAITIDPEVDFNPVTGARGNNDSLGLELDAVGDVPLKYNTRYTVTIGGAATNNVGVEMEEPHEFRFTTGAARIIATSPADGATGFRMYHDNPMQVYFNAPIDKESISRDDVEIRPNPPSTPNISFREDPETGWSVMVIGIYGQADEKYSVKIRSGVRTIGGSRVENTPYEFSFRTHKLLTADEVYGTGRSEPDRDAVERERERRQ